jgi:hypothetical protein
MHEARARIGDFKIGYCRVVTAPNKGGLPPLPAEADVARPMEDFCVAVFQYNLFVSVKAENNLT